MKKIMCVLLAAAMLAAPAFGAAGVSGSQIKWKKSGWSITGEGADTVYEGKPGKLIGWIKTSEELAYNCIEYDLQILDNYGVVDGNVGFCYDCGDAEYFFELNTVGNYLRIRLTKPTEALKTSNTGYELKVGEWHHFKYILGENVLKWYIDDKLVCRCSDTSECAMDKGVFLIQGYNTQPQVKNIVFSNADVSTVSYDFEFDREDSVKMFSFETAGDEKTSVEDGAFIWPQSGAITSVWLDTAPGDRYSMKLPLRNTFCVRLRNESDTKAIRLSYITDTHPEYSDARSKTFEIEPYSDWFTYYFNVSDTSECDGYLRGFRFEPAGGSGEGRILIDAITPEREEPVREYAGSLVSCTAADDKVTVKLKLDEKYAGKNVTLLETSITNYDKSISRMRRLKSAAADGTDVTFEVPLQGNGVSRLSSHFYAVCDGAAVCDWFTVENYYDYSENPYAFDIPSGFEVKVTDAPYNAKGDGFTDDTAAIQKAVDDAEAAGGGKVVIPGDVSVYGKRYIVTNIDVKSSVELYIDEGAVLWQSPREADYKYKPAKGHDVSIPGINWTHAGLCHNYPLVYAHQAHNVKITGKGTIRLNDVGSECPDGVDGSTVWTGCSGRIHLIALALVDCTDVQISGVTINRANCYHLPMFNCSRVYISDVTMREATCASGDGIGLSSACHDIKIDRCFLYSNDDAVTLTSSYNDPRGLVWWSADPDRDNSVHDVEVCHSDLFGGHGLTFITWGTDNPDLSKQEIYNIKAYDNVLSGGCSVGTWCDNPYYGGPFDNSETDDWSPVRDVRLFKNRYDSVCTLLSVRPTSFFSDCGIRSASDFQNGDFERRNGKKGWISGISAWSVAGDRGNVTAEEYGKGHRAVVGGDTLMYQGLYVKNCDATVSFSASASGKAYFFTADGEGRLMYESAIPESDEPADVSFTVPLSEGTYFFGVRTAEGSVLSCDGFRLTQTERTSPPLTPGDVVPGLGFTEKTFDENFTPIPITFTRSTVGTDPVKLSGEGAGATDTETDTSEPAHTAPETEPAAKTGGLPAAAKIGIGVAAAAAAGAIIAAILKKKRK